MDMLIPHCIVPAQQQIRFCEQPIERICWAHLAAVVSSMARYKQVHKSRSYNYEKIREYNEDLAWIQADTPPKNDEYHSFLAVCEILHLDPECTSKKLMSYADGLSVQHVYRESREVVEQRILSCIEEAPGVTVTQVYRLVRGGAKKIEPIIQQMVREGRVRMVYGSSEVHHRAKALYVVAGDEDKEIAA
jgi:hypothetical protein